MYAPDFDESLRGLAHISGFEPRINNIVNQSECHIRPEKEWSPNPKDRHQAPIDERVRNAVSVYSCYSRTGWRPRGASLASPLWLVGANHTRLTSMASGAASLRRRLALCAACAACAALGAALALLRGAAVAPSRRPGATDRAAATLDGSAALAALAMRPAWHPPPGAARPKQAKCVAAAQASEQKPRAYPSAFFGSAWRWDDRTDHCDRSALASARDATPETCATLCCEKPKSVGRSGPLDARSLPPSRAVHPLIEREMLSLTLTPALPGWRRALLARWRYARRPRCPLRCACATPRRPTRRSWWTT